MYGAIIGDIIGSPYEWANVKNKDFRLLSMWSRFTDDSVMTIAVAEAVMDYFEKDHGTHDFTSAGDEDDLTRRLIISMRKWGLRYPDAGYGGRFFRWLKEGGGAYNSWGNGSAMRVSSVGWLFDDIDSVRKAAALSASVTHDHPEGIKGAESIASAVFLARKGRSKEEIKEYIVSEFGYDLDRTCDEIRPGYEFDVSCQGSVPEAIIAFLEGKDYEDVVRNAVSLGGDSDTIGAMAGSIAEAFYGIPGRIVVDVQEYLEEDMKEVLARFAKMKYSRSPGV